MKLFIFIISFAFIMQSCKSSKTITYRGNEIRVHTNNIAKLIFLTDSLYAIDSLANPMNKRWKFVIVSSDIVSKNGDGLWSYMYYTTYSTVYQFRYILVVGKSIYFQKDDSLIDAESYYKFYSIQNVNFSKRRMKKIKNQFIKERYDTSIWSTQIRR
ncbi:MAG: hypothetical protein HYZ42_05095 [Bacteroidetes bacterium]|nr:hypothetical protein [Bacteroidota bacterium]